MRRRIQSAFVTAAVALWLAPGALAQCAMCKAVAEAQSPDEAKAMNLAILVLLVPTVLIFVGILFWALRFKDQNRFEPNRPDTARIPQGLVHRRERTFHPLRHGPPPRAHVPPAV